MRHTILRVVIAIAFIALAYQCTAAEPPQVLDDFSDATRWSVVAAEGVDLKVQSEQLASTPSVLRLDFDFVTGGGFAGIRRELPLDLPPNFEIAFSIRGDLPLNNLEVKLVDETGNNVWWVNRRRFEFPRDWQQLASRRRHFQFAWGPSSEPINRMKAIEIVVASAEGGHGTIYLDDITFRPLPETKPYTGTPTATATSATPDSQPGLVIDGDPDTAWISVVTDRQPGLTIDFGAQREFGGLIVNWRPSAHAQSYGIQFSDDADQWSDVRSVNTCNGRPQFIALPDSEARALRFVFEPRGSGDPVAIREIEVLPLEAARDANAFAEVVARRAPRGHYPRAIRGEGTFWTIIGPAHGKREALISEDGAVEVDKESFSIEPFVQLGDRLLSWADSETTQSLANNEAPVPTVRRRHDDVELGLTAFADRQDEKARLYLLYTVTNTSDQPAKGRLLLAMRPFQVNPPYQWLNTMGGISRVEHISAGDTPKEIEVDGRAVLLGEVAAAFGCAEFDEGDAVLLTADGNMPARQTVHDPQRAASAVVAYDFDLTPAEHHSWAVCVPMTTDSDQQRDSGAQFLASADPVAFVRDRQQAVSDEWITATSTFDLLVPGEFSQVLETIRSTLAYILINRDGLAIHPGSRSYERSWIRDGSLTSAALLRFGLANEARDFVDWYGPYQFESGKVPCVVDRRGPDPVPENDSHGQYIMAVMNVYRFTNDREFLERHWPRVQRAVAYIEELRALRQTPEFADPETTTQRQEPGKPAVSAHAFYGLMPESISHEGYSAKPMHSYWDDFFTLRGLKDATDMARVIGDDTAADRFQALADDFASTLYKSIELARKTHHIDYIPGCVELGDFDATSTTIALWPCGELNRLPRPALDRTFDRYWDNFVERRDNPSFTWDAYTPYEVRTIGSLALLGHVDRAHEAIDFFMHDRRPPGWNQWPEVVYREPRTAKFLGDLPHTWCGSDFLNSVRLLFLWEHDEEQATVLLAGIPLEWISGEPIGFRDMPTYGGRLTCTLFRDGENRLRAEVSGDCPVPPGGFRLAIPQQVSSATVNDKPVELDPAGRVIVRELPAKVEVH